MARKKNTEKSESAAKSKGASSKEALKNGLVNIESDSKKELSDLKKELSDLKKSNGEMKSKLDSQKEGSDEITSVYNNAKTRISKLEEIEVHSKVLEKEIEDLKSKSKHGGSETPVASSFNGVVEAHGDHINRFGSDQIGRA